MCIYYTLYIVHCTMYNIHCAKFGVQDTLYSVQCIVYIVHSIYGVQCMYPSNIHHIHIDIGKDRCPLQYLWYYSDKTIQRYDTIVSYMYNIYVSYATDNMFTVRNKVAG